MQPWAEPLPICDPIQPTGLFLITDDHLSVAPLVAAALQQRGATPIVIPMGSLLDLNGIAAQLPEWQQTYGPVHGIVHLAGLVPSGLPDQLATWRQWTQIQTKSLFQLLKLCATDLQTAAQHQQGRVLSASILGGYFGRMGQAGPGLPSSGSGNGLLKTLVEEWPGIRTKVVDFDTSLSAAAMADHLIQELLLPGGRVEVAYPQGIRTIFRTVEAPFDRQTQPVQLVPTAEWVTLITGGARGITAEIATDLAAVGMTLILTGRSPEPPPEAEATQGVTDLGQLRKLMLQQAKTAGETPTPVMIERRVQGLFRDRSIRENIDRCRALGARVEYLPVDVRDPQQFGGLIDGIYARYGRLDAVIHGAGIIQDKLIVDKTLETFEQVHDTKVDSSFILSQSLRSEGLKLLVFFSSVAGRYGNRGQSDYASANETMNRLAWQLDQAWPGTRVIAINWGPWDTTGMASEEVKRQFRERGVIPIDLLAGRQFFLDEIQYGSKGQVEVIAGQAPWEKHESDQGAIAGVVQPPSAPIAQSTQPQGSIPAPSASPPAASPSTVSSPAAAAPAIDGLTSDLVWVTRKPDLQPNGTVTLEHTFSLDHDPYLEDHCLDGKPVVPAAAALEWMAEFVQAGWTDWIVAEVRDQKVLKGMVFDPQASLPVLFRARASSHADSESLQVATEMVDPQTQVAYYRASLILRPQLPEPFESIGGSLPSGEPLDPQTAYHNYLFHGPRFQVIQAIRRLSPDGIDAQMVPSHPINWANSQRQAQAAQASWLFDPALVDAVLQMGLVSSRVAQDATALPTRLGAVIRYQGGVGTDPLQVAFRIRSMTPQAIVFDTALLDPDGYVRLQLEAIEMTCSKALNRLNDHWRAAQGLA